MKKRGFVFIELVVVFAMIAILITMTVINVFGSKRKATLTGTIDSLVADIRSQQTKAMTGTVEAGVVQNGYGLHFQSDQYVLFRGASYSAASSSNAAVPLDTRVTFSAISFPNGNIVFASKSGEFIGFAPASNTISVHQLDSGETKTIQVNHYGVIASIN